MGTPNLRVVHTTRGPPGAGSRRGCLDGPERGRLLGLVRHELRRCGLRSGNALDALSLPRVRVVRLSTESLWHLLRLLTQLDRPRGVS